MSLFVATLALCAAIPSSAQSPVPLGLMRFGTTGVFSPQAGNCLSIFAMNSSGQSATDSGTPCAPSFLLTAYTNATTSYTAIMALPVVQGSLTVQGECKIIWEGSQRQMFFPA
jgi:hypothetical protein